MASITSWIRLEPDSSDTDLRVTVGARIFDPVWMLARQWQLAEFQAEDAGSPAIARVRGTNARLTRCQLGELPPNTATHAPKYDPEAWPLEAIVERRRMRPATVEDARMLTLAVEAGLHFVRMLEGQPLSKTYRAEVSAYFAMPPAAAGSADDQDPATARYVRMMAGRAPDGRSIEAAIKSAGAASIAADPALGIAPADRAEVEQTLLRWLAWYETLFTEPPAGAVDPWIPSRLEYAVSVAARLSPQPEDERTLTALEYDGGRLDWSSFDLNAEVNMGTLEDRAFSPLVATAIPAPVTFRGAPAPRFWEMEDARVEYGLVPVGPTDLAQLLMIEYVSSYGNDWFVMPLELPIGSLTSIDSLIVIDVFGVHTLHRPIGDRALPKANWSMWQLAYMRMSDGETIAAPHTNLFFLPPAIAHTIESGPVEEVWFMRDEMANLAWAIESTIENAIEQPSPRREEMTAVQAESAEPPSTGAALRYMLSTMVPESWIPLLPVQLPVAPGRIDLRLRRGAVLQPDGWQKIHEARGEVLNSAADLLLFDEEVPREGLHLERRRQLARWTDGSTWVWTAYRKQVGRGEGASGLRFDRLGRG
jgi:hypothetical protein